MCQNSDDRQNFGTLNFMDHSLFNLINQFALKWFWLDVLGILFARYLGYILIFCLVLFLVGKFRKYWQMVLYGLVSAFFARFVIVGLIRWFWQRPRPFALLNFTEQNLGGLIENNVNLLLDYTAKPSFPSGHAAFFFALSTIIYFYNKKAGILFLIASFLICLARVFVGIHWPSDILAGAIVGIFSGWVVHKISKRT